VSDIDYDIDEPEDLATPEADEVFQAEPVGAIPVEIKGITPVISVGGRTTGFWTFQVSTTVPQKILSDDPRRTTVTIIPIDNDIRVGGYQSDVLTDAAPLLPAGVPLVLNTSDEIWAVADISTAVISVFTESWAR
jgi:hypothetical protein